MRPLVRGLNFNLQFLTQLFLFRMGSKVGDYVSRTRIGAHFHQARESRKLVLIIVAIALLLDNMLLTTVGQYQIF